MSNETVFAPMAFSSTAAVPRLAYSISTIWSASFSIVAPQYRNPCGLFCIQDFRDLTFHRYLVHSDTRLMQAHLLQAYKHGTFQYVTPAFVGVGAEQPDFTGKLKGAEVRYLHP